MRVIEADKNQCLTQGINFRIKTGMLVGKSTRQTNNPLRVWKDPSAGVLDEDERKSQMLSELDLFRK
ncbi:MAG: hypothetical protein MUP26_07305, partial [Desulfobulbaceae bacterium]|nr:hypothetical protein [Desulfobulbaceae bacterium]